MSFPPKVKEDVMVACSRHCSLCHKFCGIKIEIHHIRPRASGGPDTFENAIPLCFDCHADMRTYDALHPKGTKYSENELVRLRDIWYKKVESSGGVYSVSTAETDKGVYLALLNTLPWNGSMSFISGTHFSAHPFPVDNLNQLTAFEYLCERPGFEFLDADLEGLKVDLLEKVGVFQGLIGRFTFPTSNMGYNQVPPEWETENRSYYEDVVNKIYDASKGLNDAYNQLIRMATRKLGILPPM